MEKLYATLPGLESKSPCIQGKCSELEPRGYYKMKLTFVVPFRLEHVGQEVSPRRRVQEDQSREEGGNQKVSDHGLRDLEEGGRQLPEKRALLRLRLERNVLEKIEDFDVLLKKK